MIDLLHTLFATNHHVTQAILPLLIGLIAGAAQAAGNEQKESGQRYEKAAAERLSPWSHLPIPGVTQANPVGDIASGAFAGIQTQMDNPNGIKGVWDPGSNVHDPTYNTNPTEGIGPISDGNAYAAAINANRGIANTPSLSSLQFPKSKFPLNGALSGASPWMSMPSRYPGA